MADRNFASRTIWTGDCVEIMRGMNSETVDLIYLDPPFNSKKNYDEPIGGSQMVYKGSFTDIWTLSDIDVEWINLIEEVHPKVYRVLLAATTNSDKSYLTYMAARLIEMPRLLKSTGSIYLHCDPTMSHSLKMLMDAIFGRDRFRREIIWASNDVSGFKGRAKNWIRGHDTILYYTMSSDFQFDKQYRPLQAGSQRSYNKVDEEGRKYRLRDAGTERERRSYLHENRGAPVSSVWTDIPSFQTASRSKELVGYPTQKPLALLKRIIRASSKPGDVILDPFCGCATTCVAAENLGRQWVGIDISAKAGDLVMDRLGAGSQAVRRSDIILRCDRLERTDLGKLPRYNSKEVKQQLYGQQDGYCAGCETHFKTQNLTVDHIVATVKGGTDHIENLQLLCNHCNSVKGDRGMEYLSLKLKFGMGRKRRNR